MLFRNSCTITGCKVTSILFMYWLKSVSKFGNGWWSDSHTLCCKKNKHQKTKFTRYFSQYFLTFWASLLHSVPGQLIKNRSWLNSFIFKNDVLISLGKCYSDWSKWHLLGTTLSCRFSVVNVTGVGQTAVPIFCSVAHQCHFNNFFDTNRTLWHRGMSYISL